MPNGVPASIVTMLSAKYKVIHYNSKFLLPVNFVCYVCTDHITPDIKVHGANMGPTWVLSASDGPHISPMNLAIRDFIQNGWCDPHCSRLVVTVLCSLHVNIWGRVFYYHKILWESGLVGVISHLTLLWLNSKPSDVLLLCFCLTNSLRIHISITHVLQTKGLSGNKNTKNLVIHTISLNHNQW